MCVCVDNRQTFAWEKAQLDYASSPQNNWGKAHIGEPGSGVHWDKAIGQIFCPSCRGSEAQLLWQGSIRSAISLLHSQRRSITNDMEKQEKILTGWAGATGGDGTEGGGGHVGSLIDQLMVKGVRGEKWNGDNTDRDKWCFCRLGADGMELNVCKFTASLTAGVTLY